MQFQTRKAVIAACVYFLNWEIHKLIWNLVKGAPEHDYRILVEQ